MLIKRTGSILSIEGPAVINTFKPESSFGENIKFIDSIILLISINLPEPFIPQANFPDFGCKILNLFSESFFKFCFTIEFSHMLVFIAGAITLFLFDANKTFNAKSSAIPFAIFDKKFAVQGTIMIISISLAR